METEKYSLVGIDGNAYAIMAYVKKAMQREQSSSTEIKKYLSSAMASDYPHLVTKSQEIIDQLNVHYAESCQGIIIKTN